MLDFQEVVGEIALSMGLRVAAEPGELADYPEVQWQPRRHGRSLRIRPAPGKDIALDARTRMGLVTGPTISAIEAALAASVEAAKGLQRAMRERMAQKAENEIIARRLRTRWGLQEGEGPRVQATDDGFLIFNSTDQCSWSCPTERQAEILMAAVIEAGL